MHCNSCGYYFATHKVTAAICVTFFQEKKTALPDGFSNNPGDFLLSQGVSPQVPSASAGLTSLFGMGRGVSPPVKSPETLCNWSVRTPRSAFRAPVSAPRGLAPRSHVPGMPAPAYPESCIVVIGVFISSPRTISTGLLNTLLCLHIQPINLVVYKGPYLVNPVGELILGWASRLDAFSGYPVRT